MLSIPKGRPFYISCHYEAVQKYHLSFFSKTLQYLQKVHPSTVLIIGFRLDVKQSQRVPPGAPIRSPFGYCGREYLILRSHFFIFEPQAALCRSWLVLIEQQFDQYSLNKRVKTNVKRQSVRLEIVQVKNCE